MRLVTDRTERLDPGSVLETKRGPMRVRASRPHQGHWIVAFEGVPDRNAAEALRGWRIFVPRGSFPSTAEDEYYWVDLIGLEVVNRAGESLGVVADLIDTGAHSVLRVTQAAGGDAARETERLIPFVAAYVDEVSREQRRITVDWGLDY